VIAFAKANSGNFVSDKYSSYFVVSFLC